MSITREIEPLVEDARAIRRTARVPSLRRRNGSNARKTIARRPHYVLDNIKL
ncbi:hypothetical protein JJE66_30950 [Bradyrhizobium diazoefficiens]|uniref:hypothetical protein n=1 Tax=Bradyrhizobium diazoefficiens TaxID=1355477 RepID=UPI00190D34E8|nr:hypothetical protein [Bradyrhizobium diazoefficiens]MBK3665627.1 hypothetical protein [Bradyrhizobium diazoefficiens]